MNTTYTAEVTAIGGRNGHVKSSDGVIDMKVAVPGGPNPSADATNPEQLFAAGYAACFQSALLVAARRQGASIDGQSTVTAKVSLKKDEQTHRYGLGVSLHIDLKGMDQEQAQRLVNEAHEICPYSVGTRGNIEVELHLV